MTRRPFLCDAIHFSSHYRITGNPPLALRSTLCLIRCDPMPFADGRRSSRHAPSATPPPPALANGFFARFAIVSMVSRRLSPDSSPLPTPSPPPLGILRVSWFYRAPCVCVCVCVRVCIKGLACSTSRQSGEEIGVMKFRLIGAPVVEVVCVCVWGGVVDPLSTCTSSSTPRGG